MNKEKYETFLRETQHTEKSITSRVARLRKVETLFQIDLDTVIHDKGKVNDLLGRLKKEKLDSSNQNLSNALRMYFECVNNIKL